MERIKARHSLPLAVKLCMPVWMAFVYLVPDQPNLHLEEDAHPPNSMPVLGGSFSSQR